MAAIDFPSSPAVNDEFTAGTTIYRWTGTVWEVKQSTLSSSSFSDSNPLMNGSAAAGTSGLASRSDHVHPSDTSKAPLASPTFTGTVTVPTPTNSTDAATKGYVDTEIAGVSSGGDDVENIIAIQVFS